VRAARPSSGATVLSLLERGAESPLASHGEGCSCVGHQCLYWLRWYADGDRRSDWATLKVQRFGAFRTGNDEPSRAYDQVAANADMDRALAQLGISWDFGRRLGEASRGVRGDRLAAYVRRTQPVEWEAARARHPVYTLRWLLELVAAGMADCLGASFGGGAWLKREALPDPPPG